MKKLLATGLALTLGYGVQAKERSEFAQELLLSGPKEWTMPSSTGTVQGIHSDRKVHLLYTHVDKNTTITHLDWNADGLGTNDVFEMTSTYYPDELQITMSMTNTVNGYNIRCTTRKPGEQPVSELYNPDHFPFKNPISTIFYNKHTDKAGKFLDFYSNDILNTNYSFSLPSLMENIEIKGKPLDKTLNELFEANRPAVEAFHLGKERTFVWKSRKLVKSTSKKVKIKK